MFGDPSPSVDARASLEVVAVDANALALAELVKAAECIGRAVESSNDYARLPALVAARRPHVALVGVGKLEPLHVEALARARAVAPSLQLVVVAASADSELRDQVPLGCEILLKPLSRCRIGAALRAASTRGVESALEPEPAARRVIAESPVIARARSKRLIGRSPAMLQVMRELHDVANTSMTVLVVGETGTGKELVASAIHELSARRARPLGVIDCGAMPEPLFESELFGHERGAFSGAERPHKGQLQLADGGTFFFDEIGNMPLAMQAKLLRVLEDRKFRPLGAGQARAFDVRFVAATNAQLPGAIERGQFRSDLLYRLAEFTLHLPPLRERGDDVLLLAEQFLDEANTELGASVPGMNDGAKNVLLEQSWPGNARELRNVVRRAVLLRKTLQLDADTVLSLVPGRARPRMEETIAAVPTTTGSLHDVVSAAVSAVEKRAIVDALVAARNNKAEAARALQIDYKTLFIKLKRYGLLGSAP